MPVLLSELGEFGFIDTIRGLAEDDPRVVVGIGDDAAVLDLGGPELIVVTTDAQFEGRHFDLTWLTCHEIGQRAGAAAISDIAAMGAKPAAVFCSAALPPDWVAERAQDLLAGLNAAIMAVGAVLAGGDTVGNHQAALDVVVVGTVPHGEALLRSGAQPGQALAVTGKLGATGAAVALLQVLRDWRPCANVSLPLPPAWLRAERSRSPGGYRQRWISAMGWRRTRVTSPGAVASISSWRQRACPSPTAVPKLPRSWGKAPSSGRWPAARTLSCSSRSTPIR